MDGSNIVIASFQLASKYPGNFRHLLDNLEQLATDPQSFEVLVKIDTEDDEMRAAVAAEAAVRKCRVRALVTPRGKGYEELWLALNQLFQLTDPVAYFVCNINDEVRIQQRGWDKTLRNYVGAFPDHIFRLRTSALKFRNYYDFWECGYAPENYAFFTKRWLDICGDWNPCFGPDSSQQYISYYLGYANYPSKKQFNRDVPILDISWRGEGVGKNLTFDQQIRRTATNFRLWRRQTSHPMQEELFRRARLLQAHIVQAECAKRCKVNIVDDRATRTVLLRDGEDDQLLDLLPYRISRFGLFLRNVRRTLRYAYYAGGGREARNVLPLSIAEFLVHSYPGLRRLRFLTALFFFFRFPGIVFRALLRSLGHIAHFMMRYRLGRLLLETMRPFVRRLRETMRSLRSQSRALKDRKSKMGRKWFMVLAIWILRILFRPVSIYVLGRRLALTLRDRDLRWLTINETARFRLRPSNDPWFDASEASSASAVDGMPPKA